MDALAAQRLLRCQCGLIIPRVMQTTHGKVCPGKGGSAVAARPSGSVTQRQSGMAPPAAPLMPFLPPNPEPLEMLAPKVRPAKRPCAAVAAARAPQPHQVASSGLERVAHPLVGVVRSPKHPQVSSSGLERVAHPLAGVVRSPKHPQVSSSGLEQVDHPLADEGAPGPVVPVPLQSLLPRFNRRRVAMAPAAHPPAAPPAQSGGVAPGQRVVDLARGAIPNFQGGDVDIPLWTATQWPSWRKLAREATGDWRRVVKQRLSRYVTAIGSPAEGSAFVDVLGAVKELLPISRSDRRRNDVQAQTHRLRNPVSAAAIAEWQAAPRPEPRQPVQQEDREDNWRMRRADELASMGALRKATQTLLSQETLLDATKEDVQEALRGLHPAAAAAPPALPPGWVMPIITVSKAKMAIKNRLPRGSAPGIDGWTTEHLLALVDDPYAMRVVVLLLQRICDGSLTGVAKDALTVARLLAFPKPNGKVRPIAIQSIWLRLAEQVALASLPTSCSSVLAESQFGVGRGTELAIRTVRKAFEADEDMALLQLDMKNAFNSVSRAAVVDHVYAQPCLKAMWGVVHLCYGSSSQLRCFDKAGKTACEIVSEEGVRQGSVLGPLLFSIALDPVLRHLSTEGRQHAAYLDDIAVVLPKQCVQPVFEELQQRLGAMALHLNLGPDKTQVLCRGEWEAPPAMAAVHVRHDFVRFLGSPIGLDSEAMTQFATKVATDHSRLFDLLPGLHPINARKILEVGGASRMVHLMRTTAPAITKEAAVEFDTAMQESLEATLDFQPGERMATESVLLAGQPLRMGGLGVQWCGHMHEYAYEAAESESVGVQHDCRQRKAAVIDAALKASLTPQQNASLRACCNSTSQRWMRDPPRPLNIPLSTDAAASAMRRRAFVVEQEALAVTCRCMATPVEGSRHVLHCPKHGKTKPHDAVSLVLTKALRQIGYTAEHEPRYGLKTSERPDVAYYDHQRRLVFVDATVISAAGTAFVAATTTSANLSALDVAERGKISANLQFAAIHRARFVPFAMEVQGGVGTCGMSWLHEIAQHSDRLQAGFETKRWVDGVIANCQAAMLNGHHQLYVNMLNGTSPALLYLQYAERQAAARGTRGARAAANRVFQ